MRKKTIVVCQMCGGTTPSGTADFLLFHCLAFCAPDCLDDYKAADEERRARIESAAQRPSKRARAA